MCLKTFIWKQPHIKKLRERRWFKLWVKESYSVRQLCRISGYSAYKLKSIIYYWLEKPPVEYFDYSQHKYLIYDGTYFHKDGCAINLMNAHEPTIIANAYALKEGSKSVLPWFNDLKAKGLNPRAITMDGEQSVMRLIRHLWPDTKIQRCLYHIQMQALIWLREHPKTQAARELKDLLKDLCYIQSIKERNRFVASYKNWLNKHMVFIATLPTTQRAYTDLKKTTALINNALKDMFHYLFDPNIPHTTNKLESFYSRLKPHYWNHRGLTHKHKLQYLQWYSYLKNQH